jgi:hypothetical protein
LFHKIEATGGAEAAAQRAAGINSLLLASRLLAAAAAVGIGGSGREWQHSKIPKCWISSRSQSVSAQDKISNITIGYPT